MIDAIPKSWKETLKLGPMFGEEKDSYTHKIMSHKTMTHKEIYNDLISKRCDIPEERFVAWCKDLELENIAVDEIDWVATFIDCFGWTHSVELRSFEYRFRMRILLPNSVLFKIGIVESSDCFRCKAVMEDITHLFWFCPQVKNLWIQFCEWINFNFDYKIDTDPAFILLNLVPDTWEQPPDVVMLSILVVKKYIWTRRCLGLRVNIQEAIEQIKQVEGFEADTANVNYKREQHALKWGPLAKL